MDILNEFMFDQLPPLIRQGSSIESIEDNNEKLNLPDFIGNVINQHKDELIDVVNHYDVAEQKPNLNLGPLIPEKNLDEPSDFYLASLFEGNEPILEDLNFHSFDPFVFYTSTSYLLQTDLCNMTIKEFNQSLYTQFHDLYINFQLQHAPFHSLEALDPYHIKCKICLFKHQEYHTLSCGHRFCVCCSNHYCNSLIESRRITPEDFICPDCDTKMPESDVKLLYSDNYEKILKLREELRVMTLCAQGKAVMCLVPDCSGYAHIMPNEAITACNKCRCSICCLCKGAVHPGITCEENAVNNKDDLIDDLILTQNWKRCPTCGIPVDKLNGCQFLYCNSPICRGKNNLCFLCGRLLVEAQHHSHFKSKGPYGDSCNTLDGIPEDPIP